MEQNSCFTFDHQSGERTQQCATHSCKSMCVCVSVCVQWYALEAKQQQTTRDIARHAEERAGRQHNTHSALWFVLDLALSDVRAHTLHFALSICMGLL